MLGFTHDWARSGNGNWVARSWVGQGWHDLETDGGLTGAVSIAASEDCPPIPPVRSEPLLLRSRMPELGTSGSVGALGGNPQGHLAAGLASGLRSCNPLCVTRTPVAPGAI
jgi:hypothetical protein